MLEETSDVGENAKRFCTLARKHDEVKLGNNLCDVNEVCLCSCGHIGWLEHNRALQQRGQGAKSDHRQDIGARAWAALL